MRSRDIAYAVAALMTVVVILSLAVRVWLESMGVYT